MYDFIFSYYRSCTFDCRRDVQGLLVSIRSSRVVLSIALSDPFGALTVNPLALSDSSIWRGVNSKTVLTTIRPGALVDSIIRPNEFTLAMLFVIEILSTIATAVLPVEDTCTVHLVHLPLTLIAAVISPSIGAVSLNHIVAE
jgi:hypothetical protein